jgi:hypothetical protein
MQRVVEAATKVQIIRINLQPVKERFDTFLVHNATMKLMHNPIIKKVRSNFKTSDLGEARCSKFAQVQIVKFLSENKFRIVPEILMSGGQGEAGCLQL